jgi:hypothetical protein
MPRNRSTLYTVVRERHYLIGDDTYEDLEDAWAFDALVGTYITVTRAEEIAGASMQEFIDKGFTNTDFRFTVKPVTFYDE